ncbi:WXG100 family type VII secretion target [Gryllotalpicola ginsengisoli]|uniref:WXG100 family type VII secretion target n=1 Tax=Gryllotalpicola ginsengisoli TaxID=444608 RepID=UPI0003B33720|nr:WXG100 family type VII secretion target [Gryllotalpicola ginsengisoli]
MTSYQVDSTAVLDATRTAQGALAQLQSNASQLTATLTALQGSWTGQASTAFQKVLGDWRATQQSIEEQMAGLQRVLAAAAHQYQESELQNYRMFAGL